MNGFIRPYTDHDKKELLRIFQLNIPHYFDQKEIVHFEDYLTKLPNTYLIIEYHGKIAGCAGYLVNEEDRSGRINWIFFHPDFHGLGLGRQLSLYCIHCLKAQADIDKLVVGTSQLVYRFFEKLGYTLLYTEENYWAPGLHLYLMEQQVD